MRIILVDDHELVRTGVRDFLASFPEYEVIGEAGTASDALPLIEKAEPDLILMDLILPGMDGVVATREILRRAPRALVVILSAHGQTHDVMQALAAGAAGYVYKSEEPAALLEAIHLAVRGERYIANGLAERLSGAGRWRPVANPLGILTDREREIFYRLADGRGTLDIASELGLSRRTIADHRSRINRKLGVRNHAELVKLAVSLGVVQSFLSAPV